jgi:RNA polymerase sigma factor (sigma-70 family)
MNESDSVRQLFEQVHEHGLRSALGRKAAGELVRMLGPDVMRLCLHRTNGKQADAEDLFQETFAAVLVQLERGQLPTSLGAYIATIVRRRSHQRYQRREQLLDDGELHDLPAESEIVERIDFLALSDSLPARMKQVLELTIRGESTDDIAKVLDTSEANVRQLRSRAIAMLAKLRGVFDG